MRSKYYVGVIEDNKIRYVTKVDHQTHSAEWKEGLSALAMPKKVAEDVAFGLRINSILTVAVIRLPWYEEVYNPIEDDWFGIVRWHEDDIREALLSRGFEPTEEAIRCIRSKAEHHFFEDSMIETGWDLLYAFIYEETANLEPRKED
jgi:hypothetical protein